MASPCGGSQTESKRTDRQSRIVRFSRHARHFYSSLHAFCVKNSFKNKYVLISRAPFCRRHAALCSIITTQRANNSVAGRRSGKYSPNFYSLVCRRQLLSSVYQNYALNVLRCARVSRAVTFTTGRISKNVESERTNASGVDTEPLRGRTH